MHTSNAPDLTQRIEKAGYYPALVSDCLQVALAGEPVQAHLVHGETTFDDTVRRHLSVLVLTASRLVFVHADDHVDDDHGGEAHAFVTSDAVPLARIQSVMLTHVVPDPASYRPGSLGREINLTVAWGSGGRIDLEPASCGDPNCEADHGYTGALTNDDVALRISADADGDRAVSEALAFARALSAATSAAAPTP